MPLQILGKEGGNPGMWRRGNQIFWKREGVLVGKAKIWDDDVAAAVRKLRRVVKQASLAQLASMIICGACVYAVRAIIECLVCISYMCRLAIMQQVLRPLRRLPSMAEYVYVTFVWPMCKACAYMLLPIS